MTRENRSMILKKLFMCLVLLAVGTSLFAQTANGDKLIVGISYIVKSTDGSGQVPLYRLGAGSPALFVPDGTEYKATQIFRDGSIAVSHENTTYAVKNENISAMTAADTEGIAQNKSRNRASDIRSVIGFAALIILSIVVSKRHKKMAEGIYREYYTRKRKQFPWLEDWFFKNPDPSIPRAHAATGGGFFIVIIFFVIGFVLLGIIEIVVPRSSPLETILGVAALVIAFIVATKADKSRIKTPKEESGGGEGLTLECPSCHCPHAWGMIFEQAVPENMETSTETTERWREDSSGNRVMGSTTTKTYKDSFISGKIVRDFKCDNCGHSYHGESVFGWDHIPDTTPTRFNPPVYAWKPQKVTT